MDDTELYKTKVKYILENDIEDMDLTFSDEEYSPEGHLVKVSFVTFSFNKSLHQIKYISKSASK